MDSKATESGKNTFHLVGLERARVDRAAAAEVLPPPAALTL